MVAELDELFYINNDTFNVEISLDLIRDFEGLKKKK